MATCRLRAPRLVLAAISAAALGSLIGCATQGASSARPTKIPASAAAEMYGGSPTNVKHEVSANLDGSMLSLPRIERYLRSRSTKIRTARPGVWHVSIDGVMILTIADGERVRIMAPIFSLKQLQSSPRTRTALMIRLLQANFDDTVDARYAIFNGIVFAAITQPRDALTGEAVLGRYLTQVVNLHKNTFRVGDSAYSSFTPHPDSFEVDPRTDESLPYPDEESASEEPESPPPEVVPDQRVFL